LLPSFLFQSVRYRNSRLTVVDQRLLPGGVRRLRLRSAAETVRAIKALAVRGAPCLGVVAAYGLAVEARRLPDHRLRSGLARAAMRLASARPTAVNLEWAVDRVRRIIGQDGLSSAELRERVETEARAIEAEEIARSRAMAAYGERLVPRQARILTICNTGPLAAPGFGTALGVVLRSQVAGKEPHVYVCETRPLLQGARLTATELVRAGVAATLIVDSAAASVMPVCDLVLVGADRVAANGDTANKVGTLALAVLARYWKKPFYVVAPTSTFDTECVTGAGIAIEERGAEEVRGFRGCRSAGSGIRVFNPAFDVTPGRLISGFVTEKGICRSPFRRSIRKLLATTR
jgi:methylthioribose-1-phosphate isomerase